MLIQSASTASNFLSPCLNQLAPPSPFEFSPHQANVKLHGSWAVSSRARARDSAAARSPQPAALAAIAPCRPPRPSPLQHGEATTAPTARRLAASQRLTVPRRLRLTGCRMPGLRTWLPSPCRLRTWPVAALARPSNAACRTAPRACAPLRHGRDKGYGYASSC